MGAMQKDRKGFEVSSGQHNNHYNGETIHHDN